MQGLATDSATVGHTPHRFEVITGDTRRRMHGDVLKGRLVSLTLAPGSCIVDIARAHGIHPQLLYTWRRAAKAGKLVLPASDTPDFASVVIDEAASDEEPLRLGVSPDPSGLPLGVGAVSSVAIEVSGVTVRLPGDADAARIAGVAMALRGAL